MKILQIGTIDNVGGAAKLSFDIKRGLEKRSIENWMAVNVKIEVDDKIVKINEHNSFLGRAMNKFFRTDGMFKKTYSELGRLPFWKEIDIVHLHNIHGNYFNILDLTKICREKKVIWTLHDPWLFGDKSKLVPEYKNIFSRENMLVNKLRKKVINNSYMTIVSPSKWLEDKVKIEYPEKRTEVIHNGVDTLIFNQKDKIASRKTLNLPPDKEIILSVSNGGKNNIEKGSQFIDVIENDNNFRDVMFISVGDKEHYIKDKDTLSLYYSSADLLLYPSLADNSPLTIMESMSCGTPVVAFDTGGIAEIIDHKINGYVAKYMDAGDLISGVSYILKNPGTNVIRTEARKKILNDFSIDTMIDKYLSLYQQTLNQ